MEKKKNKTQVANPCTQLAFSCISQGTARERKLQKYLGKQPPGRELAGNSVF
jgi:hypothetical protein